MLSPAEVQSRSMFKLCSTWQIDQFDYSYLIIGGDSTNRLDFVDDPLGSSGNDLADQNAGNYDYDEIGNLIEDTQGHIEEILWNNSNKIERIKFDNGDPTLEFRYDAGGNRVVKIVKPSLTDGTTWIYTYYVRDAQGNILAVYDRRHLTQEPLEPCETPVIGEGQLAPPPGLVSDPETGCWTDDWFDYEKLEFFKASEYHLYGSSRLGLWQANRYLTVAPSGTPECSYDLPYGYNPYADPDSAGFCACDSCDQGCEEAYDIALAHYCQGDPDCELPPDWCAYNELTPDPCGCPPCINVWIEEGVVVNSDPCQECYCAEWPVEPEFVLDGSESPHEKRHLTRGRKRYEGSNHLGNVLVVFSDRKLPIYFIDAGTITGYQADVHAHSDYYPFGYVMEERTGSAEGYRFGFQGQETDDEVYGAENAVSFKYRVHDARIGRFLSIDPLIAKYPQWSPYTFSGNQVIHTFELEGLEPWSDANKYAEQLEADEGYNFGYSLGISVDITWEGSSSAVLAGLPAAAATNRIRMEIIRGGVQQAVRQGSRYGLGALSVGLGAFISVIYGGSLTPNPGPADPGYQPFVHQQPDDDPQEDDDDRRGMVAIGYMPAQGRVEDGDPMAMGHLIIGISFEGTEETLQWYENNGAGIPVRTLQRFVPLSPIQVKGYIYTKGLVYPFAKKTIPLQNITNAHLEAQRLIHESQLNPRLYDPYFNSCVSPCEDILFRAGYNPPVGEIKELTPRGFYRWFQKQPDLY